MVNKIWEECGELVTLTTHPCTWISLSVGSPRHNRDLSRSEVQVTGGGGGSQLGTTMRPLTAGLSSKEIRAIEISFHQLQSRVQELNHRCTVGPKHGKNANSTRLQLHKPQPAQPGRKLHLFGSPFSHL